MIKDRKQKLLAAKYCSVQGIVPFLEVVVRSQTGLEEAPVDITDIDVLGLHLGRSGAIERILFDCRTGAKLSPINRALWAGGLKALVGADRVFIIQKKEATYSHKLAATSLDISLHSENSFRRYAQTISTDFTRDSTYLDNANVWETFVPLSRDEPRLTDLCWYATTQAALERSGPRGVRLGLSVIMKAGPELDPKRPVVRLLFETFLSGFLVFLSLCANDLKEVFKFSMEKDDFEKTVRYFMWEGRENYQLRRQMKTAIEKAKGDDATGVFDLPEWRGFLHMIRAFLDAPEALPYR